MFHGSYLASALQYDSIFVHNNAAQYSLVIQHLPSLAFGAWFSSSNTISDQTHLVRADSL